jgi:parallel beta-helix repeat protein
MKYRHSFCFVALLAICIFQKANSQPKFTQYKNSSKIIAQIQNAAPNSTLDFQNDTVSASNLLIAKPLQIKNLVIIQTDENQRCITINLKNYQGLSLSPLSNIRVIGKSGKLSFDNYKDKTFAAINIFSGSNDLTLDHITVSNSSKQGAYIELSGNAALTIRSSRFENNGGLTRSQLLSNLDASTFIINVSNATVFSPRDQVWIGDEVNQIDEIDGNTIRLKNDGNKRTPVNGLTNKHYAGQYITKDQNFFNGATIAGNGRQLNIINCTFSGNAHFGLYNQFSGKAQVLNSTAANNGYIGFGNSLGSDFLYYGCTSTGNSNNGIDFNQASNGRISHCTVEGNGVDGIFIGQGSNVTIDSNTTRKQMRFGILANGNTQDGITRLSVLNNTCEANRGGICLTSVSRSSIKGNIISRNEMGLLLQGQNNSPNPTDNSIEENNFKSNLTKDMFINVKGYLKGGKPGNVTLKKNAFDAKTPKMQVNQ